MKELYYKIGTKLAILPVLLAPKATFAQALGQEDLFGGIGSEEFAGSAGLGSANLTDTIASIIRTILGFLGIIAVVIILFGGFKWMTSGGAEEKVKDAKKLIISGIIGLVIVLSAFAIASFVITNIAQVAA
ncbi:pilin [Patescibacteria group bacterium]|nr:pilin [Patescibacteria group bacterium]MBU1705506.1 pilin [Patescibacteria group bacterium]